MSTSRRGVSPVVASGRGGSPAVGTSEESTAGGVLTLYGQLAPSAGAFGSALASVGLASVGLASRKAAAETRFVRSPWCVQICDGRADFSQPRCDW